MPTSKRKQSKTGSRRERPRLTNLPSLAGLPDEHPSFIPPMQCKLVRSLPVGEQWRYELKLNGCRALAVKTGTSVSCCGSLARRAVSASAAVRTLCSFRTKTAFCFRSFGSACMSARIMAFTLSDASVPSGLVILIEPRLAPSTMKYSAVNRSPSQRMLPGCTNGKPRWMHPH